MKVCIIGAGLGGIATAVRLAQLGNINIVVIDCDDLSHNWNPSLEPDNSLYPVDLFDNTLTYGIGFGGSTNLWHGVMTELDNVDKARIYDFCPGISIFNQPLDKLDYELFPVLSRLKSSPSSVNDFDLSLHMPFIQAKQYAVPYHPPRLRSHLRRLLARKNCPITVLSNTRCISVDIESGTAKRATCIVNNYKRISVSAEVFVLSSGALETPRILMNNPESRALFGPHLGRNLLDHPNAVIANITFKGKQYGLHPSASFLRRHVVRRGYTFLPGILNRNPSVHLYDSTINTKGEVFQHVQSNNRRKAFMTAASASIAFSQRRLGLRNRTASCLLWFHHEVMPSDGGSISSSGTKDPNGQLRVNISYPGLDSFFAVKEQLCQYFGSYSRHPGSVFRSFSELKNSSVQIVPGSHYSGTCRASADVDHGVVDNQFRCHLVRNLYIGDASVFPVIGNSNLSLSILRVAKSIVSSIASSHSS